MIRVLRFISVKSRARKLVDSMIFTEVCFYKSDFGVAARQPPQPHPQHTVYLLLLQ